MDLPLPLLQLRVQEQHFYNHFIPRKSENWVWTGCECRLLHLDRLCLSLNLLFPHGPLHREQIHSRQGLHPIDHPYVHDQSHFAASIQRCPGVLLERVPHEHGVRGHRTPLFPDSWTHQSFLLLSSVQQDRANRESEFGHSDSTPGPIGEHFDDDEHLGDILLLRGGRRNGRKAGEVLRLLLHVLVPVGGLRAFYEEVHRGRGLIIKFITRGEKSYF